MVRQRVSCTTRLDVTMGAKMLMPFGSALREASSMSEIGIASGQASRPIVQERRVPWGDADPAGTLYFAHVSRYCMEAIEQWFVDVLEIDWLRINAERRIGTPMVRAEIDFKSGASAGEVLAVTVAVEKLGRSSMVFRVQGEVTADHRACWEGRFTCVFIDASTRQSIAIPDDYRSAITRTG
jgi:YbgC/YbaW family acyl-CoA thioester hydrolase